jgi:hypothetical protein
VREGIRCLVARNDEVAVLSAEYKIVWPLVACENHEPVGALAEGLVLFRAEPEHARARLVRALTDEVVLSKRPALAQCPDPLVDRAEQLESVASRMPRVGRRAIVAP